MLDIAFTFISIGMQGSSANHGYTAAAFKQKEKISMMLYFNQWCIC